MPAMPGAREGEKEGNIGEQNADSKQAEAMIPHFHRMPSSGQWGGQEKGHKGSTFRAVVVAVCTQLAGRI